MEFRKSRKYGNSGKRCGCAATPHVAVPLHPCGIQEFREIWEFWEEMWLSTPLWNSGIPGNLGILGRDVAEPPHLMWLWLYTPLEFRNSGKYGNSGKRCHITALGPLEFRNSGKYGNSGKRCHITALGPLELRNSRNYG